MEARIQPRGAKGDPMAKEICKSFKEEIWELAMLIANPSTYVEAIITFYVREPLI